MTASRLAARGWTMEGFVHGTVVFLVAGLTTVVGLMLVIRPFIPLLSMEGDGYETVVGPNRIAVILSMLMGLATMGWGIAWFCRHMEGSVSNLKLLWPLFWGLVTLVAQQSAPAWATNNANVLPFVVPAVYFGSLSVVVRRNFRQLRRAVLVGLILGLALPSLLLVTGGALYLSTGKTTFHTTPDDFD